MDGTIRPAAVWTWDDIAALISESAREGPLLEFKAGPALGRDSRQREELVKDATGLANGGGGTIVYGVAEGEIEGQKVAIGIDPVIDPKVTPDWISNVLKSNTQPPLRHLDMREIAVPEQPRGRVLVLVVEQGDTAHQSMLDRRYYQRGAATTEPMFDFQIRDVMGRRSAPSIDVTLLRDVRSSSADGEDYVVAVKLENVGVMSLERWFLEFYVPESACWDQHRDPDFSGRTSRATVEAFGDRYERFTYSSHTAIGDTHECLYPGQSIVLNLQLGLPTIGLRVTKDSYSSLLEQSPSIRWRLYVPNARPIQGEESFDSWCTYSPAA